LLVFTVAARLVAKGSLEVSGHQLHIMESPSVSSPINPAGTSVFVENVPSGWMKPLQRYLENPDNGGGEIIAVKAHDGHAQVTFIDAQGLCFMLLSIP